MIQQTNKDETHERDVAPVSNSGKRNTRTTDNEHQFQIESERSLVTIEQAVLSMVDLGGDIRMFSFTMLRAAAHLFAEVHSVADLERAMRHLVIEEQSWRQPCGRAFACSCCLSHVPLLSGYDEP